jgi:hypothetical protein
MLDTSFILRTRSGRETHSVKELSWRRDFLKSRLNSKTDPEILALVEVVERRLQHVSPPVEEPKAVAVAEPVLVNDRPVFQEPARSVAPIEYHRLGMVTVWPSD